MWGDMGWGRKGGHSDAPSPSSLTTEFQIRPSVSLSCVVRGEERGDGLAPSVRSQSVGWGLCRWDWGLKVSLDSSKLSQIPAPLRDGALVGKSRTGAWSFPTSPFPASDWEQWDQMSQGAGVALGVGVRGACEPCVWDGGGGLNRASTEARCRPSPPTV